MPKAAGIIEPLARRDPAASQWCSATAFRQGYGGTPLAYVGIQRLAGSLCRISCCLAAAARDQLDLCGYLNVISCDGNVAWRLARRGIIVTEHGLGGQTIKQADGARWPHADAHLETLRRSLANLRRFWDRHRTIQWRTTEAPPHSPS